MSRVLRALTLLLVSASALSAQVQNKQFSVVTRVGSITPERAASLNAGPLIGLDTEYSLNKYFGIGTSLDVTRTNTHREDFLTRLRYGNAGAGGGDSIFYQYVGQPINTINISAFGLARIPVGKKLSPFVMAGVGTYTMIANTQVNGKATRKNELSYTFGGGVWLKLGEKVGVQFDARALQFQKYDRNFLNPAAGRAELKTPFPEDFPVPPAAKKTALNTMLTLGFRYIPGGVSGGN
ncbi:MAG: outer membrane beta-barrel protein [Gemmatimonadaceae bacterium]|nr:outer membrane beta-barrel protein [Gemmatimonadaceae bacterium]